MNLPLNAGAGSPAPTYMNLEGPSTKWLFGYYRGNSISDSVLVLRAQLLSRWGLSAERAVRYVMQAIPGREGSGVRSWPRSHQK